MKNAYQQLMDKVTGWLDSLLIMLPNLILALVILGLFFFLSRLVNRLLSKLIKHFSSNQAVMRLIANLSTVVILIIGLFIALDLLHLDKTVTSLLAGAGVLGLAVGLAFQDPILNIISGVLLSIRNMPFNLGDLVQSNGSYGIVNRITLRSTIIRRLDGVDVIIPNKMVLQNPIENISLTPQRRVDISCGVGYRSDLEHVKRTALNALEQIDRNELKAIEFMFTDFGDSSINFVLRYWISTPDEKLFLESRSDAIISLKKAFDVEAINIPFPIRTLEFGQKEVLESLSKSK